MHEHMGEIERRMGIQPIDELLERRRELVNAVAVLRAKYGAFGTYNDHRKIQLSTVAQLIRLEAMRDKVKRTGAEVDDAAHAHPDYVQFVATASHERAEWVRLEAEIEEVDATINRGQAVARYVVAEMHLSGAAT